MDMDEIVEIGAEAIRAVDERYELDRPAGNRPCVVIHVASQKDVFRGFEDDCNEFMRRQRARALLSALSARGLAVVKLSDLVTKEDMEWAEAEARKISPGQRTRPLAEFIAELKAARPSLKEGT